MAMLRAVSTAFVARVPAGAATTHFYLTVLAFGGMDGVHQSGQCASKRCTCSSARPLQQFQDPACLATTPGWSRVLDPAGPFTRLGLRRHQTEPRWALVRGQALRCRPNPGDSYPPVGEFLDWLLAGQCIPDF